jgi:hypothetical protein
VCQQSWGKLWRNAVGKVAARSAIGSPFLLFLVYTRPIGERGGRLDVVPSTAGRVSPSVSILLFECSNAHSPAAGLCSSISLNICDELFCFISYLGVTRAYTTDNVMLSQLQSALSFGRRS